MPPFVDGSLGVHDLHPITSSMVCGRRSRIAITIDGRMAPTKPCASGGPGRSSLLGLMSRALVSFAKAGFSSMPSHSRPRRVAHAATVPEPKNGSSTRPGRAEPPQVQAGSIPPATARCPSVFARSRVHGFPQRVHTLSGQVASSGRSTSLSGKTA